jgi:hypothetical protein
VLGIEGSVAQMLVRDVNLAIARLAGRFVATIDAATA